MKIVCLAAGFVLGWMACIVQALLASKGFGMKPITNLETLHEEA